MQQPFALSHLDWKLIPSDVWLYVLPHLARPAAKARGPAAVILCKLTPQRQLHH